MTRKTKLLIGALACLCFALGALAGKFYPEFKRYAGLTFIAGHDAEPFRWPDGFKVVEIDSSADGAKQKAYFSRSSSSTQKPLLVSLHVWSGSYASKDALAAYAKQHDWNYIHPDFRGANETPDSCLSPKVVSDIDDAIVYALREGNVDIRNIFVVGFSGGGYATAGMYLKSKHPVRAFLAWAPITDLHAWYWQSAARGNPFTQHILQCTSDGKRLDKQAAWARSPLYWEFPQPPRSRIELYAGIDDGYKGTVPISHSIQFYNRLAEAYGDASQRVTEEEMALLLSRGGENAPDTRKIADRAVLFNRSTANGSLTIFQGVHEMLAGYCFERLRALVEP
ncbi:MAG TPA: prolyl oligopeptidase family serine peptidase [Gammaproteobacteria bacterium]|nr:prolyl oligopeptidase family serine peptidase [Gammaproteobacteria bacterium]